MDYQILACSDQAAFRKWLSEHGESTNGIWLKIYKKASGVPTVDYAQALDEALCFGWIDGQKKSYDEQSYLQKFTPRRPKSIWSKRNIEHIQRLKDAGLMMPAGLAEVEKAQADGRWDAAYDAQSTMEIPDDFMRELAKHPQALAFFNTLNKTNKFAIAWRLQTAKTDATRARRAEKILASLIDGKALH